MEKKQLLGVAGSVESNDCLITVTPSDEIKIHITSIVDAFFHEQIEKVILDVLKEENLTLEVTCQDKGALDYTIKARLLTAISRMRG